MIRLCSLMIFVRSLPTALFSSSPLAIAPSSSSAIESSESAIAAFSTMFGKAMLVAGAGDAGAQQTLPAIDGAQHRAAEDQELHVLVRRIARAEQVVAELVGERPVV